MSTREVADIVNQEFNTVIHPRSIIRYIQNNKVGINPSQRGPLPGLMEKETLLMLAQAFDTHVCLNQINQEPIKFKQFSLLKSVQQVMSPYQTPRPRILEQRLKVCPVDFKFEVATTMEDRRTKLTSTYKYLSLWFDQLEHNLNKLGFGTMVDGKLVILNKQLQRIMNIVETALSLSLSGQLQWALWRNTNSSIFRFHSTKTT